MDMNSIWAEVVAIMVAAPGANETVYSISEKSTRRSFIDINIAGVAQLVEHFLAKEDVTSSSLVTRSKK